MATYSEVVVFQGHYKDPATGWQVLETNITEERFAKIMQTLARDKRLRFYEKDFKCYTRNDIQCENRGNQDIRVFQRRFEKADINNFRGVVRMRYEMTKIPYHQFTSTMHIHDIVYVKRMSAKVNNRVGVHFEISMDPTTNKLVRRVFASCNGEGKVDIDNLESVLEGIVRDMCA